ncbi:hypothetical protein FS837_000266 [Tulasnella sp. UAMH 9824]|nr:hypothetical protein FS837_000266 [Tulasnella sp. UAMH 9824]
MKRLLRHFFPKKPTFQVDHPSPLSRDEHDLSYIHALPPEVLQEIFYEETSRFTSYQIVNYYRSLFSIRSVCKYWKEVVDTTPRLWTGITSSLNQNILAMALQKSSTHPLYVEHAGYPDGNDAKLKLFLAPSAERWDRLGYRWTYDSNPRHEVLSLPLRSLRYLKINGTYGASHNFPLDAPVLDSLAIHSFSLDWTSLSGLRFLRIVETPGPSTAELLSILKASPQLQYLMLRETRPVYPNPDFLPSVVYLPQLKDLSMISLPILPLSYILDQIEAPGLQRLVCKEDGSYTGDLALAIRSAGRHIGACIPPQEEIPVELWVCFQREMFRFAIGGRVVDYWGTGWNPFTEGRRLAHFAAFVERIDHNLCQEVQVLALEGEPYHEGAKLLHILHRRFPQIEELLVKDVGDAGFDSGEICEQLSSPGLSEGAGEWLFPNLTSLGFDASVELAYERILSLIEIRKGEEQTKTITQLNVTGGTINPKMEQTLRNSVEVLDITGVRIVEED